MSLINDALKEASKAGNRLQPSPSAARPIPMRPVEGRAPAGQSRLMLPMVLIVVLALSGWCFQQWWSGTHTETIPDAVRQFIASKQNPEMSATAARQSVKSETASTAASESSTTTANSKASKTDGRDVKSRVAKNDSWATVPAPRTAAAEAQPNTPARPFPALKLQGVSFRKNGGSSVLINGRILSEGDEVDGFTVTKIEAKLITVEHLGQQKELRLK